MRPLSTGHAHVACLPCPALAAACRLGPSSPPTLVGKPGRTLPDSTGPPPLAPTFFPLALSSSKVDPAWSFALSVNYTYK